MEELRAVNPGGKSYALLLEVLRNYENPGFGAVIFRRTSTQFRNQGGLWDESVNVYTQVNGYPIESKLAWQFPSGARVKLAHLEYDKTVLDFQGAQIPLLCCEENEKVRMGNGSLKFVKDICPGDFVMTLAGSKEVLIVGGRRLEQCVNVKTKAGNQVHSTSHKILTTSGWVSYEGYMSGESLQPLTSLSTQCCCVCKFEKWFARKCQALLKLLGNPSCRFLRSIEFDRQALDPLSQHSSAPFFCKAKQVLDNCFEWFRCARPVPAPPPLIRLSAIRFLRFPQSSAYKSSRVAKPDESFGGRILSLLRDWKDRYWSSPRLYGEQSFWRPNKHPSPSPSQDGVEQQIQTDLPLGGRDKAQKRTPHKLRYAHPYRGTKLISEAEYEHVACEVSPCGKRWVIDLTIKDVSHYITESGLVNKNCFDELTHFTEKQFFYMLSRNRSTCGVKPYIRATCNPDCDSWVRKFIDWWIGPDGHAIKERSGVVRWFIRQGETIVWGDSRDELVKKYAPADRPELVQPKSVTFIPSSIEDNKILMEKDPGYMANLMALSRVDRMRLLGGNWNVRPTAGMYFQRDWFEVKDAIPAGWIRAMRFWDRASSKPNEENKDPDWTRGLRVLKYPDGKYGVVDLRSMQDSPFKVEQLITTTASHDGGNTEIMAQQDPGSAGVGEAVHFTTMLAGYIVKTSPFSKDKVTRAKPVSAQCEVGNVWVLRAPWNDDFFTELENFPDGAHDDIVDTLSGAFNELCSGSSIFDVL